MKTWKVTAELNMDASHYESIIVNANTERKARIIGEEKFKSRPDVFFVTNLSVSECTDQTPLCPKCKKPIEIVSNTNWDNLVTDYYPLCHACGWTTSHTYSSKDAVLADLKDSFATT